MASIQVDVDEWELAEAVSDLSAREMRTFVGALSEKAKDALAASVADVLNIRNVDLWQLERALRNGDRDFIDRFLWSEINRRGPRPKFKASEKQETLGV